MHVSFEEYPLFSYIDASGFEGGSGYWSSIGLGSRIDYRVTRFVSLTADFTSSFVGSPVVANTFEVGTRVHRERTESRAYPFADVRFGWISAYTSPYASLRDIYSGPGNGTHSSQGIGALVGVGTEYALTRRFSLTAGASVMRSGMKGWTYSGTFPAPVTSEKYSLTAYRFVLGLRYNPVRLIRPPEYPESGTE